MSWVWVPDAEWRVKWADEPLAICRHPKCAEPAVAVLYRHTWGSLPRPWSYCAEHMYGRRIIDGVVHVRVHPASRSAREGVSGPLISRGRS